MGTKITIERDGEVKEVIENPRGYLAAGIGETTEQGTAVHQMMVADNIGEKEVIVMLARVLNSVYKATKRVEVAEAVIAMALAKAKLENVFGDDKEISEEEVVEAIMNKL